MSEIAGILLTFAPLFFILLAANAAEDRRTQGSPYQGQAAVAYSLVLILYAFAVVAGLMIQVGGAMAAQQPELLQELGLLDDGLGQVASLTMVGVGIWLPSIFGILLLLPAARRTLAKLLPIDAESPVHAVALSLTMLVAINLLVTLGIGLGNLTDLLTNESSPVAGESEQAAVSVGMLWVQQLVMALLAMIGVGWLTRRSWSPTLVRLGIEWPTRSQVWLGIGLGLLLVPVIMALELAANALGVGANPDVEALTEQLIGPLFRSPLGIITLGMAAALGEETLFRGAMQPRFGLVLTSLLFALVHSNYGVTVSTLVVFLLGLILGWLRIRHNTSTAMIMHAVYNSTLGLLAYLSLSFLDL